MKILGSKKIKFIRQSDSNDCGPSCLRMISSFYGKYYSREELVESSGIVRQGITIGDLVDLAESINLRSLAVKIDYKALKNDAPLPCIAHWRDRHYVVVYKITDKEVHVADPSFGTLKLKKEKFLEGWLGKNRTESSEGLIILIEPTKSFFKGKQISSSSKENKGLRFLIPYFSTYKRIIYQLLIGLLAVNTIQLIIPFLTQSIVDYGINYQDLNFIYIILIAQVVLVISRASSTMIRDWLLLHLGSRINIKLISDFLVKVMGLPMSFFDTKVIGDLLQRIKDHDRINNFLSTQTLEVLFSSFSFITFGIVLAYFDWNIFIIYFIGTAAYIIWVSLFMKKREKLDYLAFDQSSANQSSLIELIQGMQEIKLNNSENKRRWKWEEIQIKLFKVSIARLSLVHYQYNGGVLISEIKNVLITFIAAKAVIEGSITLGVMLSIQYIIGQLNGPIRFLVSFIQAYQDTKISIERVREIHLKEDEKSNDLFLIKNINDFKEISLENVTFKYGSGPSSPFILKNLFLKIPENKVTAIVGVSGSGKTTLLKLLMKFYKLNTGVITVGGDNIENLDTSKWRKICGVVMQNGYIFNDTIAANIAESDYQIDKGRLLRAVEISNLKDFVESLPLGYNTKIGAEGLPLSGGQRQRVLIARAIYKNPDFLFFDEATSSLDANNEKVIMGNLEKFYQGKTVIVIAHRLSTVKNADQIIVLHDGEIVEKGNHNELAKKRGHYYTLVKNQLELGN